MEYWIDYGMPSEPAMVGMRMPDNYVVEMFIDRMSASKKLSEGKIYDRSRWNTICREKSAYHASEVRERGKTVVYAGG